MRRLLPGLFLFLALLPLQAQEAIPKLKFTEVREIAPGVFFRFSSISATDKSVVFGGSNNIWIVFEDYVLVYDANFPKEAGDVIEAIRKTTDKPIRYVLDSHHHGDHAYGNAVFSQAGASIISSANTARILRTNGPAEFEKEGKGPTGRKDVAASYLKVPDLIFDEKLVLEDAKQRVEIYHFGHAHTAGDSFLYLPKHKILCTGDACTNGPFNYMGHSDSASWIRVLEKAQQLDVKLICPGHGPLTDPSVLGKQRRYFVELRQQVKAGIDTGKEVEDIIKSIEMPWHKEWTGIEARERVDNIKHVFDEFTGRTMPWDLIEDFGLYEGPSPTKKSASWTAPKKIIVPPLMPAKLRELKRIAPDVLFVPVKSLEEATREVSDADAVLGFCSTELVNQGKKLRWIHLQHAGIEKEFPAIANKDLVVTNAQKIHGPNVADQGMGLLLALTRKLRHLTPETPKMPEATELHRKTMLLVGLGGLGTQIARRAEAAGMRVRALDSREGLVKPSFVFSLESPGKLMERLPEADVVVLAVPLTEQTRGMIGQAQFEAMKQSALLINIARGGLVKTADLQEAIQQKKIAGAGLDVTDPEPLPADHPLWKHANVLIAPHNGGASPDAQDRLWRLLRENVRRFAAGEPMLSVVDNSKGY